MDSILKQINDNELNGVIGCVKPDWNDRLIPEYFSRKKKKLNKYDPDLLWLLMYENDYSKNTLKYLDKNYIRFKQILDSGFAKKVVSNGKFQAHVWEMILCDVLSSYGTLVQKGAEGADILMRDKNGHIIQVEAVMPNEATDPKLQTVKPIFDKDNFFGHSGNINDMELPVVLRFLQAFDKKATKQHGSDKPLIFAINTGLVVGMTSHDEHVLRQALFGLACHQITHHSDGSYSQGFQQMPKLDKGRGEFPVARFRDSKYDHVSGVIYSSQKPHSLTPHGYGWSNSGLVYVPNPRAAKPISIDFDCMSTITVTEKVYEERKPKVDFKSAVQA